MRCIVAWSRSSAGGAAASPGDTQRRFDLAFDDFGFAMDFDFEFDAARLCAFTTRLGAVARLTAPRGSGLAALRFATAVFGASAEGGVGAATTGAAFGAGRGVGAGTGGRGGTLELVVLSGGSGCFRGRPLFRAACPSAISLSNAAFASASKRACCELRALVARSFSARNRSSG